MLFGPPNAGKTSLMRTACLDLEFTEIVNLFPTRGISIENFLFDGEIDLNIWDIGGVEKYIARYFFGPKREYVFSDVGIAIFVVDATCTINNTKQMFDEFVLNIFSLSPYIVKIYVLLNKIDLRDSQENHIIELLSFGLSIVVLERLEFAPVSIRDGSAQRKFVEIVKIQAQNRLFLNKKLGEIELFRLERAVGINRAHLNNYCVSCSRRLHIPISPRKYKNYNVFELRFCCSCYKKYGNQTIDEFPKSLIEVIKQKVKDYIEIIGLNFEIIEFHKWYQNAFIREKFLIRKRNLRERGCNIRPGGIGKGITIRNTPSYDILWLSSIGLSLSHISKIMKSAYDGKINKQIVSEFIRTSFDGFENLQREILRPIIEELYRKGEDLCEDPDEKKYISIEIYTALRQITTHDPNGWFIKWSRDKELIEVHGRLEARLLGATYFEWATWIKERQDPNAKGYLRQALFAREIGLKSTKQLKIALGIIRQIEGCETTSQLVDKIKSDPLNILGGKTYNEYEELDNTSKFDETHYLGSK